MTENTKVEVNLGIPPIDTTPITLENVCEQVGRLRTQVSILATIVGIYFTVHFAALAVGIRV